MTAVAIPPSAATEAGRAAGRRTLDLNTLIVPLPWAANRLQAEEYARGVLERLDEIRTNPDDTGDTGVRGDWEFGRGEPNPAFLAGQQAGARAPSLDRVDVPAAWRSFPLSYLRGFAYGFAHGLGLEVSIEDASPTPAPSTLERALRAYERGWQQEDARQRGELLPLEAPRLPDGVSEVWYPRGVEDRRSNRPISWFAQRWNEATPAPPLPDPLPSPTPEPPRCNPGPISPPAPAASSRSLAAPLLVAGSLASALGLLWLLSAPRRSAPKTALLEDL